MGSGAIAPIPPNGILLHIGPHKTGTTAIQTALLAVESELAAVGVLVPDDSTVYRGVTALTGARRGDMEPGTVPARDTWAGLDTWVRERPENRLAISSEWFDDCTTEMITMLRESWGDRIRVLITIRPLEKIFPSTWQQAIKTGAAYSYPEFLKPLLRGPEDPRTDRARRFWHRQDHAALVARWADVVGIENVVVAVPDSHDRGHLYRLTESLLGVTEGILVPSGVTNRSLTVPEITAVRLMYQTVLPVESRQQQHRWLQRGAVLHLVENRKPPKGEARLTTPAAAVARIREINQDVVQRLAASGVSVIGDLNQLVSKAPLPPEDPELESATIDPQIAALLVTGLQRIAAKNVTRLEERLAAVTAANNVGSAEKGRPIGRGRLRRLTRWRR